MIYQLLLDINSIGLDELRTVVFPRLRILEIQQFPDPWIGKGSALPLAQEIAAELQTEASVVVLGLVSWSDNRHAARLFTRDKGLLDQVIDRANRLRDWSMFRELYDGFPVLLEGQSLDSVVRATRMVQLAQSPAVFQRAGSQRDVPLSLVIDEFNFEEAKLALPGVPFARYFDEYGYWAVFSDVNQLMTNHSEQFDMLPGKSAVIESCFVSQFSAGSRSGKNVECLLSQPRFALGFDLYGTGVQVFSKEPERLAGFARLGGVTFWI